MHRALGRVLAEELALVISHGGVMRLWLLDVLGEPVPLIGNGVTYLVEHDGVRRSRRELKLRFASEDKMRVVLQTQSSCSFNRHIDSLVCDSVGTHRCTVRHLRL